jgi:hypothetical protein
MMLNPAPPPSTSYLEVMLATSKNELYGNGAPRFLVDSTFPSSYADVTATLFSPPCIWECTLEHNTLIGNQ